MRALKGHREQVIIATKFGIVRDPANPDVRSISGKPDYVQQACEASLRRLGVECIDLYYQHRVDPDTPIEETLPVTMDIKNMQYIPGGAVAMIMHSCEFTGGNDWAKSVCSRSLRPNR